MRCALVVPLVFVAFHCSPAEDDLDIDVVAGANTFSCVADCSPVGGQRVSTSCAADKSAFCHCSVDETGVLPDLAGAVCRSTVIEPGRDYPRGSVIPDPGGNAHVFVHLEGKPADAGDTPRCGLGEIASCQMNIYGALDCGCVKP